jgi:hypothetical protein
MRLTGTEDWDDLYVKLDTAANTSEFFFNGISFGVISHGATPSNSVGSVRLERLDRSSANGDTISFDNLTVGAMDMIRPRLNFLRTGNTLELSWPATGMGFKLQSTPSFTVPVAWTLLTNGIRFTNVQSVFTTTVSSGNQFYRLKSP